MIFVDGLELGEPDDAALRDRRTLSADGVVLVAVTVSFEDFEVAADPEIAFRGVPFRDEDDSERLLDDLADAVEDKIEEAFKGKVREPALIRQDVHDVVAELVYKRLKRRPMVLPVVVEV
jgi:ribonuclease J